MLDGVILLQHRSDYFAGNRIKTDFLLIIHGWGRIKSSKQTIIFIGTPDKIEQTHANIIERRRKKRVLNDTLHNRDRIKSSVDGIIYLRGIDTRQDTWYFIGIGEISFGTPIPIRPRLTNKSDLAPTGATASGCSGAFAYRPIAAIPQLKLKGAIAMAKDTHHKETVSVVLDRDLADAIKVAAQREFMTVSGVVRSAVVRDLREKGILAVSR